MANVFGGGGSSKGGSGISTSSTPQTTNANVGPSVLKQCNAGSGAIPIVSTSPDALLASDTQTFASSPNNYSKTVSTTTGLNFRDFYTKSDIHRLLKAKADISSVYTKSEVDAKMAAFEGRVNSSLMGFITESEVDEKISGLYDTILSYLSSNYYDRNSLYTKSQIDSLLEALTLGEDFILKQPSTTLQNTIDPGSNNAVTLTLKASSNPDISTIQHWVDDQSNSVGRVRKSGRVEFYGHMVVGQTIETWRPALDANIRRISGVADPIHTLDAVNKKYVEDFIITAVSNAQLGLDKIYDVDCLTY
jgi:hypothetical protein